MLHRCANCPGITGLQIFLESKLEGTILENDEWISTDKTTLEESIKPISEYLDILIQEIEKLTTHHFTAKSQSNYLENLKETLKPNEAINILDFAENYSFVVQDAVQG